MKHVRWPDVVQAWQRRQFDQAYDFGRQFLRAQPNHVDALLLVLQMELARQDWVEVGRICVLLDRLWRKKSGQERLPVAVLLAWARACMTQRMFEQAEACCRRVLEQDSSSAEASRYLAVVVQQRGLLEEARQWYERSLEQQDDPETALNLGVLLLQLDEYEQARLQFQRVVEAHAEWSVAWRNLALAWQYMGQQSQALLAIQRARELQPDDPVAISNHMFLLNYMECPDQLERMAVIHAAGQQLARIYRQRGGVVYDEWTCVNNPRQLRIGLVGGDFCAHPVGYFLRAPLQCLREHPVEIVLYDTCPVTDEWSGALRQAVWRWRDVSGMNDAQLVECIHADDIHVLIDVAGHTAHNRLSVFCARPAPLQMSWLGYFATTGVPGIDYILVDPWVIPPHCGDLLSEKPLYLPQTYRCFQVPDDPVVPNDLPMHAQGSLTLGCFNNLSKVNARVRNLWIRILRTYPQTRLFLKAPQFSSAQVRDEWLNSFVDAGVEQERLILEGPSPRNEYLQAYHRVDLALDPFPYTGGTVSIEALWMGVPVLTLKGSDLLSRSGANLLGNLDMTAWIADDEDAYHAKVGACLESPAMLAELRATLRSRLLSSSLCDAAGFAHQWQRTLWSLWREHHPD